MSLKASGKNLDAEGGTTTTVANVQQWDNCDGSNQHWVFEDAGDGWVYIVNKNGYYLDAQGGWDANHDGGNVQAYAFNGSDAQKWKPVRVSGVERTQFEPGAYTIRSAIGNRVLDVSNASSEEGAQVQVWTENGDAAQLFSVGWADDIEANNIRLAQDSNADRWLDAGRHDGTGCVSQYSGNGGQSQNWFFEDAGEGWYYIRNIFGYYLDVEDAKDADGTKVVVWSFLGSDNQKWRPEKPNLAFAQIAPISHHTYNGSPITPDPEVTYAGRTLVRERDYTVSYADNAEAGIAQVIVRGTGAYAGSASAMFEIVATSIPDLSRDGWVDLGAGDKGYVRDGHLVTGWMDLGSSKYWFAEDGAMATGWTDVEQGDKIMHYYFNPASGNLVRNTWFQIEGKTYYFRPSGNMATGFADVDDNGVTKKYYLDEAGQLLTGWQDIEVNGNVMHYYFRPSGSMATGWATIDGEKYWFRPSGNMATGWADVDDAYKRYFDEQGHMVTGWQTIGGKTYYFRPSGAMQTGTATIDGVEYAFSDKGVLITPKLSAQVEETDRADEA